MSQPERPRYLVKKGQQFYWYPSKKLRLASFKIVKLGTEEAEAIRKAEQCNTLVDAWAAGQPARTGHRHGTLPWVAEQYKNDHLYSRIRDKTSRDKEIDQLLAWSSERGDPPMRTIRWKDAKALWTRYGDKEKGEDKPAKARHLIGCARILWNFAMKQLDDDDVVDFNPFDRFFQGAGIEGEAAGRRRREVYWEPVEIDKFLDAALEFPARRGGSGPGNWLGGGHVIGFRKSLADAVVIASNTAQRPGDILALRESNYDGERLKLTQSKGGKKVDFRVTEELKAWLDDMLAERRKQEAAASIVSFRRDDRPLVINEVTGTRYYKKNFGERFREVRMAAGLPEHLQFRDFRRTGVVRLSEAGCSPQEVSAISGHSIDETTRIIETYCPRTKVMADNAIEKLEAWRRKLGGKG